MSFDKKINLASLSEYLLNTLNVSYLTPGTEGYIIQTVSGVATWQPLGAVSVTLAGDVTGPAGTNTVINLTGVAGTVTSSATNIQFISTISNPSFKQASTGAVTGQTFTIQAQNSTAGSSTGGAINITSGTGTALAGAVRLQTGGTTRVTVNATGVVTIANLGLGVVHADASGNLTSSTVVNADITGPVSITKLAAGTEGYFLQITGGVPTWGPVGSFSTTLAGDVTGTSGANTVVNLSGLAGVVTASATTIQFNTGVVNPTIKQITGGTTGQTFTISAQSASTTGGAINITSGTGTTAGVVRLQTGGTTRLTINPTGVITIANLSTGVVHADASGNLTSSTIIDTDVAVGANIQVSKLQNGTPGYILSSGGSTPTWINPTSLAITLAGDVTGLVGSNTVVKINGNTVPAGPLTVNHVLKVSGTNALTYGFIVDANVTNVNWTKILSHPTTLVGYGITDAVSTSTILSTTLPLTIDGGSSANLSVNRTFAVNNATTSTTGVIRLTADLAGSGASPVVVGLTGTFGVVAVHGSAIVWDASQSPNLSQLALTNINTVGTQFSIIAQNTSATGSTGGALNLFSGDGSGGVSGKGGNVNIGAGAGYAVAAGGVGGNVNISAGAGYSAGSINITAGAGTAPGQIKMTINNVDKSIITNNFATFFGELCADFDPTYSGGKAIRMATNGSLALIASNQFYTVAAGTDKYSRNGGSSRILFDTTTGSTAGDISFSTSPSGSVNTNVVMTDRLKITQAGYIYIPNTAVHPSTPSSGVYIYALAGKLYALGATGTYTELS